MSSKILFFGNEKLATGVATKAHIFNGLIEAGFQVEALIVSQSLDIHKDQLEVVKVAKANNIEVRSYKNLKHSVEDIKNFGVDAAVLAAYGKIVPKEILELFKGGIVNVHPSLLPKHRGPTPIESAILNGDSETGVSIMRLAEGMDSGPVYRQQSIKLSGRETKQDLADALDNLGKELLVDCLGDILESRLQPSQQSSDGITYDKRITKEDGLINWQDSWLKIDRMIRAYNVWPKVRFNVAGIDITLLQAHHEGQPGEPGKHTDFNGSLAVYNSDGLVVIDQLLPASGKVMSGKDFVLGHQKQLFS